MRSPSGSTDRAIFSPSLFARSYARHVSGPYAGAGQGEALTWLAAVTARIMAFGLAMKSKHIDRISSSISDGWSPMGTLVIPGRSTSVRFSTCGENIRRLMVCFDMPLFVPVVRSVSRSISLRMSYKITTRHDFVVWCLQKWLWPHLKIEKFFSGAVQELSPL